MAFPRISTLKTASDFQSRLDELKLPLSFDEVVEAEGPLAQPIQRQRGVIGNRFCILPMEGWDGERDGKPSDLTRRRWTNFGLSGAKLIWGGEAVAVRHDGRANPNQLLINEENLAVIGELRELLTQTHQDHFGRTDDLLVGLQLTHSGRFARPNEHKQLEPRIAYRHPLLDQKFGISDDSAILSDDDLAQLTEDFITAAKLAHRAGFTFVDIKQCHGYLGHEMLSGFDRPGAYGGSFENRTKFIRDVIGGIRAAVPDLEIVSRISVFDIVPFQKGEDDIGVPMTTGEYRYAFGGDGTGMGVNLDEPMRLLDLLAEMGVEMICASMGSPYYNPHAQRPAAFPPSDGYLPPEDPLVGVDRQIQVTAQVKQQRPEMLIVGSGYSYLQEWLPNVGQRVVRDSGVDFVGLGRMVLSYPDLPADVLAGRELARKKICRTFSECTTAPRNGMVSGCFPLDPYYKARPERERLLELKHVK